MPPHKPTRRRVAQQPTSAETTIAPGPHLDFEDATELRIEPPESKKEADTDETDFGEETSEAQIAKFEEQTEDTFRRLAQPENLVPPEAQSPQRPPRPQPAKSGLSAPKMRAPPEEQSETVLDFSVDAAETALDQPLHRSRAKLEESGEMSQSDSSWREWTDTPGLTPTSGEISAPLGRESSEELVPTSPPAELRADTVKGVVSEPVSLDEPARPDPAERIVPLVGPSPRSSLALKLPPRSADAASPLVIPAEIDPSLIENRRAEFGRGLVVVRANAQASRPVVPDADVARLLSRDRASIPAPKPARRRGAGRAWVMVSSIVLLALLVALFLVFRWSEEATPLSMIPSADPLPAPLAVPTEGEVVPILPDLPAPAALTAKQPLLSVITVPAGAEVEVNGRGIGDSPLVWPVPNDATSLPVTIRLAKHRIWIGEAQKNPSGHFSLSVALEPR